MLLLLRAPVLLCLNTAIGVCVCVCWEGGNPINFICEVNMFNSIEGILAILSLTGDQ